LAETGTWNKAHGADAFGFSGLRALHWNYLEPQLVEESIARGEAKLSAGGPLVAETGQHTGRSPKDKFVVRDATTESTVWWENNGAITPQAFDQLMADMLDHAKGRELFAQDLHGGADPATRLKTRVFTEYAWHSLFIRNLLIRPAREDLASFVPDMTIVDLPSFRADPQKYGVRSETVIACDFTRKIVLIGGTSYAGEMKKSVFTMLNFLLPPQRRHADALLGQCRPERRHAVFFGLSGTGKTTLSADPNRTLIGDDEHGWGKDGVFNFEGGCYAKCIKLSREAEPEIFATTQRFGTVLENVVSTRSPACRFRRRLEDREHPRRLSARFHPERLAHRPRRPSEEHRDADRRRLRRDAADRQADPGRRCITSSPATPPRSPARRRASPSREPDLLHLLRRALHAAPSVGIWQPAARADRRARRRLLAGQHRLDRRQVRRRPRMPIRSPARCCARRSTAR
jgi:hypothetical protein